MRFASPEWLLLLPILVLCGWVWRSLRLFAPLRAVICILLALALADPRRQMLDDVTISNGLGWSPDGTTMYYVDTPTLRVDMFDFDPVSGDIANRREFVTIRHGGGRPDGLTVDSEGAVWVATWPGYGVHRYLLEFERAGRLPVESVVYCLRPLGESFRFDVEPDDLGVRSLVRGLEFGLRIRSYKLEEFAERGYRVVIARQRGGRGRLVGEATGVGVLGARELFEFASRQARDCRIELGCFR